MEFFSEEHKAQVIELIENAKDDDEARNIYEELCKFNLRKHNLQSQEEFIYLTHWYEVAMSKRMKK